LLDIATDELVAAQDQMLLSGRKTALKKLVLILASVIEARAAPGNWAEFARPANDARQYYLLSWSHHGEPELYAFRFEERRTDRIDFSERDRIDKYGWVAGHNGKLTRRQH
jgi:hypothetical protein